MKKRLYVFLLLLSAMLLLFGCKSEQKKDTDQVATNSTANKKQEEQDKSDDVDDWDDPDDESDSPDSDDVDDPDLNQASQGGSVEIYTIDSDTLDISPLTVSFDKQINAKLIVEEVVKNLDEEVKIAKVEEKKNGTVIVAFKDGKAPMKGCSGQVEELILNCISSSILDNLSSCEKVVFQGEKGAYESGHMSLGLNEAYATK